MIFNIFPFFNIPVVLRISPSTRTKRKHHMVTPWSSITLKIRTASNMN